MIVSSSFFYLLLLFWACLFLLVLLDVLRFFGVASGPSKIQHYLRLVVCCLRTFFFFYIAALSLVVIGFAIYHREYFLVAVVYLCFAVSFVAFAPRPTK